ncbi:MAG: hypothetical protein KAR21_01170 [Spirochaetales bacterium]|nr:hypothetical protein [Spirochaetales bacterium]
MGNCYNCGEIFELRVYRNTECPSCGKDAKVCLNCRFYSPGSHWDCSENIREAVREKDRANFCDFFELGSNYKGPSGSNKEDDAKKAFDSLFGD